MNKLIFVLLILLSIGLTGCPDASQTANTSNINAPPRTATPVNTPPANNYADSRTANTLPTLMPDKNRNEYESNKMSTSMPDNKRIEYEKMSKTSNSMGNVKATPNPTVTSATPAPAPTEKKEEGLFFVSAAAPDKRGRSCQVRSPGSRRSLYARRGFG